MTDKGQPADDELREKLAAIEHERWSDWHKWCHKVINENMPYSKPLEIIMSRWDIQANTSYERLSREDQLKDLEQVDRYWPLLTAWADTRAREAELNIISRIEKELIGEQSIEIDESHDINYYYTTKSVEWAIERIRNQVKAELRTPEQEGTAS